MVVGGNDEEPGAQMEGDDNAPEITAGRDASHGANTGHHIVDLKRKETKLKKSE